MSTQAVKYKNDFNLEDIRKPALANKWAKLRSELKSACNKRTDEEISLYECAALTSWESM